MTGDEMREAIVRKCEELKDFLLVKNSSYGNSVAEPLRVFARKDLAPLDLIGVRLDDKLSRLARGSDYPGDNDIQDIAGYLVLYLCLRDRSGPQGYTIKQRLEDMRAASVNTKGEPEKADAGPEPDCYDDLMAAVKKLQLGAFVTVAEGEQIIQKLRSSAFVARGDTGPMLQDYETRQIRPRKP